MTQIRHGTYRIAGSAAAGAALLAALWGAPGTAAPRWTELCSTPARPAAPAGHRSAIGVAAEGLAAWIVESRDAALREGVEPIPQAIREQLEGFVPEDVLETVRWRVGSDSEAALQHYLTSLGLVAVTLDTVVVFSDRATALENAGLWAHELRHVMQYADCGVTGFAGEYLHDYAGLEADASDYASRWHQWRVDAWLRDVTEGG